MNSATSTPLVSIRPAPADELEHREHVLLRRNRAPYARQSDPAWPTANGRHRDKDNLNRRIVQPVVAKARELIEEDQRQSEGAASLGGSM